MRIDKYVLPVPSAVAAGAGQRCESLYNKTVVIEGGAFNATLQVQGSFDGGTTWHDIGLSKTAPDYVDIGPLPITHVRVKTTAYIAGTPTARLLGYNARHLG